MSSIQLVLVTVVKSFLPPTNQGHGGGLLIWFLLPPGVESETLQWFRRRKGGKRRLGDEVEKGGGGGRIQDSIGKSSLHNTLLIVIVQSTSKQVR